MTNDVTAGILHDGISFWGAQAVNFLGLSSVILGENNVNFVDVELTWQTNGTKILLTRTYHSNVQTEITAEGPFKGIVGKVDRVSTFEYTKNDEGQVIGLKSSHTSNNEILNKYLTGTLQQLSRGCKDGKLSYIDNMNSEGSDFYVTYVDDNMNGSEMILLFNASFNNKIKVTVCGYSSKIEGTQKGSEELIEISGSGGEYTAYDGAKVTLTFTVEEGWFGVDHFVLKKVDEEKEELVDWDIEGITLTNTKPGEAPYLSCELNITSIANIPDEGVSLAIVAVNPGGASIDDEYFTIKKQ